MSEEQKSADQNLDNQEAEDQQRDPVFQEEQAHLSEIYHTLQVMGRKVAAELERVSQEASQDKKSMSEELAPNFATYADAMETYADFMAMNRIIDAYNLAQDSNAQKLLDIQVLLRQPYFAKVALQVKPGQPVRDIYIGNVGISDDNYKRLVVDWRSPVAEVYYNQENGPTSYVANGRTINVDLKVRRQFDITEDTLNAYFDTSVAIQDSLLLASLSKQRSAHMQAITATIQKEQNVVVRHEDVPALLVGGIAGSGKTSVLMQRIAYLFYQNREHLDPSQVYLITPNEVFGRYVEHVLPDLGEKNPHISTWDDFSAALMPKGRNKGNMNIPLEQLDQIDRAMQTFEYEPSDFRELRCGDTRFVSVNQLCQIAAKYKHIEGAAHKSILMREEIESRLKSRLSQMANDEDTWLEIEALGAQAQIDFFGDTFDPQDEREARTQALQYLENKYASIFDSLEGDDWVRIDRIGMRLLGAESLDPVSWLYLRMSLTGLANPDARYVMIDEVQDYTLAQLAVLARYFKRAHFMLLGDENQAIKADTASFAEIRDLFIRVRGSVEECSLMTSYRSSPEITALFVGLLSPDKRMHIESIQRADTKPRVVAYSDEAAYKQALRSLIDEAQARIDAQGGITAIIVPWKAEAKQLQKLLGEDSPRFIGTNDSLPERGVIMTTLPLAKGLEFDHVIIPNAIERVFPDEPLARRQLYTTISRATNAIDILANGALTPLLAHAIVE